MCSLFISWFKVFFGIFSAKVKIFTESSFFPFFNIKVVQNLQNRDSGGWLEITNPQQNWDAASVDPTFLEPPFFFAQNISIKQRTKTKEVGI